MQLAGNGGLGAGGDSGGAVRAVKSGATVSATGEGQSGGVWQHANQWTIHPRPHHHLLWPHHHLPHRYWRSHLHWIMIDHHHFFYICMFDSETIND